MKVTPDRYLTYRYAGASGDFNPIHLDDEFARSVGLPGKILHGLWTMAQCARAQGDGLKLQSLSVQFRGMGVPEQEITVTTAPNTTIAPPIRKPTCRPTTVATCRRCTGCSRPWTPVTSDGSWPLTKRSSRCSSESSRASGGSLRSSSVSSVTMLLPYAPPRPDAGRRRARNMAAFKPAKARLLYEAAFR